MSKRDCEPHFLSEVVVTLTIVSFLDVVWDKRGPSRPIAAQASFVPQLVACRGPNSVAMYPITSLERQATITCLDLAPFEAPIDRERT
jgi:hypothetical protein